MRRKIEAQRGTVLMVAMILVLLLAGLSLAYVAITGSQAMQTYTSYKSDRALYIAEVGLADAMFDITENNGTGEVALTVAGGNYAVDTESLGLNKIVITSTGLFADTERVVEVVIEDVVDTIFEYGFFSDETYSLYSNTWVDSYDSEAGSYESQISGTYEGQEYASANGPVGSNGSIYLDANVQIFGDAHPGPTGEVTFDSNTYCAGNTVPLPEERDFPPITLPPAAEFPVETLTVPVGNSATIAPGEYNYDSITLNSNSSLTIQGPATIVVGDFRTRSNTTVTIDGTNGPVVLYGTGAFQMDSNTAVESLSQSPVDLQIFITGDQPVAIRSNATLYATLYAPNAQLILNSNSGFWGAATAGLIQQESNFPVHYDEALGRMDDEEAVYEQVSWREVTPAL